MADKKISELTSATVVNNADLATIVQSGTNKKVSSSIIGTYVVETETFPSLSTTEKTVKGAINELSGIHPSNWVDDGTDVFPKNSRNISLPIGKVHKLSGILTVPINLNGGNTYTYESSQLEIIPPTELPDNTSITVSGANPSDLNGSFLINNIDSTHIAYPYTKERQFINYNYNWFTSGAGPLNGIWVSGHKIYVASASNGLYKSINGGLTFANKTSADGLPNNILTDVFSLGDLLLVSTSAGLGYSKNDWATWGIATVAQGLGSNDCRGVYATDNSNWQISTSQGWSYTTNGGTSFINRTTIDGLPNNLCLASHKVGSIVLVATSAGLGISINNGVSFVGKTTAHGLPNNICRSVLILGSTYYVCTDGGLAFSTDGGTTWTTRTTANGLVTNSTTDIAYFEGVLYVACSGGATGGVAISLDGGVTFVPRNATNGIYKGNLTPTKSIAAHGGKVYLTYGYATPNDHSISFDSRFDMQFLNISTPTFPTVELRGVYVIDDDPKKLYVGTYLQGLMFSVDGGITWTNKTTANGLGNNDVLFIHKRSSNGHLYAFHKEGVSKSTDSGSTWTQILNLSGSGTICYYGLTTGANNIYVCCTDGFRISTNDGGSWTLKTSADGLGGDVCWQLSIDSGGICHVATINGLSIAVDVACTSFTNYISGNNVRSCHVNSSGKIYAGTNNGLAYSIDGGANWTWKTRSSGLRNIDLYGMFVHKNKVYAVSLSGSATLTLNVSIDYGETFSQHYGVGNNLSTALYLNAIYATDENIYLGSINAGLYYANVPRQITTNDSLTINDHYGVFVDGNNVYVATSDGLGISTDFGKTWSVKKVADGLGNNFVNSVWASGLNIYAATNGGISISTNGGTSFTNYQATHVFISVYVSGSYIYGGTAIDGYYVSSDGGANWTQYLAGQTVHGIYANGINVYLATGNGVYITTNGGGSFITKTTADGLGSNDTRDITVNGSYIYVGTSNGASISADGGTLFINHTIYDGLPGNIVSSVYKYNDILYVGTNNGIAWTIDNGNTGFKFIGNQELVNCDAIYSVFMARNVLFASGVSGTNKIPGNIISGALIVKTTDPYVAFAVDYDENTDSYRILANQTILGGSYDAVISIHRATGNTTLSQMITLTPRASAPYNPKEGMLYVDNTAGNHLYIYLNSGWHLIV